MRSLESWRNLVTTAAAASPIAAELARLRSAPEPDRRDFASAFRDDLGHRRRIYRPVLLWTLDAPPPVRTDAESPELAIWLHLCRGAKPPLPPGQGALCPALASQGIEAWTEAELASLHALWWLAETRGENALRERALGAASWLIEELQPDNATNRPWAMATFIEMAATGDDGASLYAEALLHNCQVELGRPDRFSAVLLLDAARRLTPADARPPRAG